jgi:hypothetical protein
VERTSLPEEFKRKFLEMKEEDKSGRRKLAGGG